MTHARWPRPSAMPSIPPSVASPIPTSTPSDWNRDSSISARNSYSAPAVLTAALMPPDDPLARHRVELRARFAVFALFDALDAAGLSTEVLRAVRAEGARIAELAIAHEIPGAPAEPCSRTLAAGPPDGVVPRFAAWRATLAAAAPDRPGMVLVLGHFANWLALAPAHETVVCRSLPAIGPVVSELGTEGITDILSVLRDVSDPGAILDVSGAYGSTDGPTVRALVRVGALTRDWDGPSVLQRLREAIPPER